MAASSAAWRIVLGPLHGAAQGIDGLLAGGEELVRLVEITRIQGRDALEPRPLGDQGVLLPAVCSSIASPPPR